MHKARARACYIVTLLCLCSHVHAADSGRVRSDAAQYRRAKRSRSHLPHKPPQPVAAVKPQPAAAVKPLPPEVRFVPFSAQFDPGAQEIFVLTVIDPAWRCNKIAWCDVSYANGQVVRVPAKSSPPFHRKRPHGKNNCHTWCRVANVTTEDLEAVSIVDKSENTYPHVPIEHIEAMPPTAVGKRVGICLGPLFGFVPQFFDWLEHHAHAGVAGVHAYVVRDMLLEGDRAAADHAGHTPDTQLMLLNHRLLSWHVYRDHADLGWYYGQLLVYNDCIYRSRRAYDYVLVIDQDEFLHSPSGAASPGWLPPLLGKLFAAGTPTASVAFATALYPVRCVTRDLQPLGLQGAPLPGLQMASYEFDWARNGAPDFAHCSGLVVPPGPPDADTRYCSHKSAVRPLHVSSMTVHDVFATDGTNITRVRDADPALAYVRHVRCSAWDATSPFPEQFDCSVPHPVDYHKPTRAGVLTCS